ncbi:endothelin-converting enzyme homolog [Amphiura filiformis]|uniref:endothelin-converting enzyme homolog n=1 Tax=Amphiura filiformis TaxID=82378 RepID=UPI003B21EA64
MVEKGRRSVMHVLSDELNSKQRYLLEDGWWFGPEAVRKTKMVYGACVDKATREANGLSGILMNSENVLGGWPVLESNPGGNFDRNNFDLTDLLANLFIKFASSSLIHVEAVRDPTDLTKFKLMIKSGKITALPNETYLLDDEKYHEFQDAYVRYMTDVAISFSANNDKQSANKEMQAVLALEKKLAKAKRDSTSMKLEMTLRELKDMYPEISWEAFFSAILPEDVGPIDDDFTIVNYDSEYLRAALDVINNEPNRLVSDWLLWLCFEATTIYLNDEVRNIYYEFSEAVTGDKPSSYPQDCAKFVNRNLPDAMGRNFVDMYLTEDSKSMVEDMVTDIIVTLYDLVNEIDWFSETEKQQVSEKLMTMKTYTGYPEYILNDDELNKVYAELDVTFGINPLAAVTRVRVWRLKRNLKLLTNQEYSDEYLKWNMKAITQANVQYDPMDNSLTVYAGIIQPPFFNSDFPWYINYGSLGRLIVKETLKAVLSTVDHTEQADCIKTMYAEFNYNGARLDADRTNAGDVLDNAALQVMIRLFMNRNEDDRSGMLPGLNMTAQQLFFLSAVQTQCDLIKDTPEAVTRFIENTPVSPGIFRVTGALQNSEYFSDAFNCSADSYMNPDNKCNFW